VSDKPLYIRSRDLLTAEEIAQLDAVHRKRMQSLQAVDELIASLLATLESVGQLDNTYLFFTSDNGYHLGEHRLNAGKYTPYETDVHVLSWPAAPESQRVSPPPPSPGASTWLRRLLIWLGRP